MTCERCTLYGLDLGAKRNNLRDSARKAQREVGRHGRPTPQRMADIARTKTHIAETREALEDHMRRDCEAAK